MLDKFKFSMINSARWYYKDDYHRNSTGVMIKAFDRVKSNYIEQDYQDGRREIFVDERDRHRQSTIYIIGEARNESKPIGRMVKSNGKRRAVYRKTESKSRTLGRLKDIPVVKAIRHEKVYLSRKAKTQFYFKGPQDKTIKAERKLKQIIQSFVYGKVTK